MFGNSLQRFLSRSQPLRDYWEKRYAAGGWGAAGDRDLSEEENRRSALEVLDLIAHVLRQVADPAAGRKLLDAGCGYGMFTDLARSMGFEALGVDFSRTAIEAACTRYPDTPFQVGDLSGLNLKRRFDVILCVNVLVAIFEERSWLRALSRLERHLSREGVLVILETLRSEGQQTPAPDHVAFRSAGDYEEALRTLGLGVSHHEGVFLSHENAFKNLLVVHRSGAEVGRERD